MGGKKNIYIHTHTHIYIYIYIYIYTYTYILEAFRLERGGSDKVSQRLYRIRGKTKHGHERELMGPDVTPAAERTESLQGSIGQS